MHARTQERPDADLFRVTDHSVYEALDLVRLEYQ